MILNSLNTKEKEQQKYNKNGFAQQIYRNADINDYSLFNKVKKSLDKN